MKNGKYGILSGSHAEVVVPFEYDDIVHVNMKCHNQLSPQILGDLRELFVSVFNSYTALA